MSERKRAPQVSPEAIRVFDGMERARLKAGGKLTLQQSMQEGLRLWKLQGVSADRRDPNERSS